MTCSGLKVYSDTRLPVRRLKSMSLKPSRSTPASLLHIDTLYWA